LPLQQHRRQDAAYLAAERRCSLKILVSEQTGTLVPGGRAGHPGGAPHLGLQALPDRAPQQRVLLRGQRGVHGRQPNSVQAAARLGAA